MIFLKESRSLRSITGTLSVFLTSQNPTGLFAGVNVNNEISISGLLPMTGTMAVYGEVMKNGMELAIEEINNEGKTVLIVTHEYEVANICKRKIEIADGQIIS
jgi:ABC-type branched-subunit amino acid transport system substrate-binding protein